MLYSSSPSREHNTCCIGGHFAWPVPEAGVKQLQSYWSTWPVTSYRRVPASIKRHLRNTSPTCVVFVAVCLLNVCETHISWWVEQHFEEYVPPCWGSNTWGHIITFRLDEFFFIKKAITRSLWGVTLIRLARNLVPFPRDAGQSVRISGRYRGSVYLSSRRLLWSAGSAYPLLPVCLMPRILLALL